MGRRHLIDDLVDLADYAPGCRASAALDAAERGDAEEVVESLGGDTYVLSGTWSELAGLADTLAASAHRYQRLVAEALSDLIRYPASPPAVAV